MDRHTAMAEFLRSRRARLRPEDVGLQPLATRRRVPGLRREELAQLAGVSVDYYIRLEQGRGFHVSDAVLDAVANALRLADDERAHLRNLARPSRTARLPGPPQQVRPALRQLMNAMTEVPAFVVGRRTDVLAWNPLGLALIADFRAMPPRQRNFARLFFLDEHIGALFRDQRHKARDIAAFLHLDAGRHPRDPLLAELIDELTLHSSLFRQVWPEHPVGDKRHTVYEVRHPLAGPLHLAQEALRASDDPDQTLITYTAAPGSSSEAGLRILASWQTHASSDHSSPRPRPGSPTTT
ncbi:helix-turn-helix transcriptional regulator [Paractinoplanes durhamensis]|uniref:DNA-binding protein n=1 Tax=Paractinoplanes durhamensis TaxID=113563 RepID=A0ABQ3Z7C6_9ACTN|nr:helix-turn-helix transcriptional regulator [Actinoplanes durhamensis]GIE05739.1 DNA-binding protein [Actinoplanes durhamensis]